MSRILDYIRYLGRDRTSPGYLDYIKTQKRISLEKMSRKKHLQKKRKKYLIDSIFRYLPMKPDFFNNALCIGCRDTFEVDYLTELGIKNVVGIDLFSVDTRKIKIMDMHSLSFADNSFDMVISSHSLEHSFFPSEAITEMIRVCKSFGFIIVEVPTLFEYNGADLHDFINSEQLLMNFRGCLKTKQDIVCHKRQDLIPGSIGNHASTGVIRLYLEVIKKLR